VGRRRRVRAGGAAGAGLIAAAGLTALPSTAAAQGLTCRPAAVSRFWDRLDALCAAADRIGAAAPADAATEAARAEVLAYCAAAGAPGARPPPAFAAEPEARRLALLAGVAGLAGLPADAVPAAAELVLQPSPLLDALARRVAPDAALQTGAAGALLVRELSERVCKEAPVREWLPASCEPLAGPEPLLELRRRVVLDALRLPREGWRRVARNDRAATGLRVAVAVLDTAVESLSAAQLARRLAEDTARDFRQLLTDPCASLEPSPLDAALAGRGGERFDSLAAALLALPPGALAQAAPAPEVVPLEPVPPHGAAPAALPGAAPASPAPSPVPAPAPGALPVVPALPAIPALPFAPTPDGIAAAAARLIERVFADGPRLDRPDDHYRRLVERVLADSGLLPPGQPLSPLRQAAARELVRALRDADAAAQALAAKPDDLAAMGAVLHTLVRVVEHAVSLVEDAPFTVPPALHAMIAELLAGDLPGAARAATGLLPGAMAPSEATLRALECTTDFLAARTDAERKRVLTGCALGLPPWSRPFLFDLDVGAVSLGDGNLRLAGSALAGYNAKRWGAVATGAGAVYDLTDADSQDETVYGKATLETWYTAAADRPLRFEGRFVGGMAVYDTDRTEPAPGVFWTTETSWLGRASLLAGIRYQITRFAAGLWLGGGGQYEYYDPLVVAASSSTVTLTVNETVELKGDGRLRTHLNLIPRWLTVRVNADADYFRLTRAVTYYSSTGQTATQAESARQLELHARGYLDAEVARFFGFVPGLTGGVNYLSLDDGAGTRTTAVPMFGAGIRRESF